MRTIRLFCDAIPAQASRLTLSPEESWHAGKVLRLRAGDAVEVLDGRGQVVQGRLEAWDPQQRHPTLEVAIASRRQAPEPSRKLHLFIAPPKGKLMSQIVRDATELGVWSITPVRCQRSVADPLGKDVIKAWGADAVEACKQSGNPFLPAFHPALDFAAALAQAPAAGGFGAVPEIGDGGIPLPETGDIAVWIGPEGGFSDEEHAALRQKGYRGITIGRWVLRVETAAVVAAAVVLCAR